MNDRLARLQSQLEQPLLVTNPVNVVYLVGFHSSNCALLVEHDRVRLFTDFRYLQAARAVEQAETVERQNGMPAAAARAGFALSPHFPAGHLRRPGRWL